MTANPDREEIRWELDKILDFLNSLIQLHQSEQNAFWNIYEKIHSWFINGRNSIIAVIGFGIGIIISLVAIEELGREYLIFIVYGLVGASIVFVGINIFLNKIGKKYQTVNEAYANYFLELLETKGWLLGASIKDLPTKEQLIFLVNFTFVISQVIGYNIQSKLKNFFKGNYPEFKAVKQAFLIAKENLEEYKKLDLKIVKTIEEFVRDFEKKDKKKKTFD